MFTGIICHCGIVRKLVQRDAGISLAIQTTFQNLKLGESIAVDGACLTVTRFQDDLFYCDLSTETLDLTIAKNYLVGQLVNLERALRMGDRFGGHHVTGHVDAVARVSSLKKIGGFLELVIDQISKDDFRYVIPKGSVTMNGVSLTINSIDVASLSFSLMIIPHTLEITNLKLLKLHDEVNIEFDQAAKTIAHQAALYLSREVAHV